MFKSVRALGLTSNFHPKRISNPSQFVGVASASATILPFAAAGAAGVGIAGYLAFRDREPHVESKEVRVMDPMQRLAARCPKLDGQPLPAPYFNPSFEDLKIGQYVSMSKDDPFRSKVKPPVPAFLKTDPTLRHAHIVKHELDVTGLEAEKDNSPYQGEMVKSKTFARIFDNVLTETQCLQLIEAANHKGFVPALQGTSFQTKDKAGSDLLVYNPEFRNVYSVMYDAPEFFSWLFAALEPHIRELPVPDGFRIDHINSFVRTLCYCRAGQGHKPHFDAMMKYPKHAIDANPDDATITKSRSFMTIFVYLSEVPPQSEGWTSFPVPPPEKDCLKFASVAATPGRAALSTAAAAPENVGDVRCSPKAGRVMIFSQNLYHAGSPLKDHIKYVIRSDVMCMPED